MSAESKIFQKPADYIAPSRDEVRGTLNELGYGFRGEEASFAIATEPTVLPLNMGNELDRLGQALSMGFQLTGRILREDTSLKKNGRTVQDMRTRTESFVRSRVPERVDTDPRLLSKRVVPKVLRPDVILTSEKVGDEWVLKGGIGEVESRPAGTFLMPALAEAYGLSRDEYMKTWVEGFNGRPWSALCPDEWSAYADELRAFGQDYQRQGGEYAGVFFPSQMTKDELSRALPERSHSYVFGYMDVWAREGTLGKVRNVLAERKDVFGYNPFDYYLETKASLILMRQPWFLDVVSEVHNPEIAKLLESWLIDGYVLNFDADQDLNFGRMVEEHNQWAIKEAGFSPEATESKGVLLPNNNAHKSHFKEALENGFSPNRPPVITQRYLNSRIPISYYDAEGDKKSMTGSARITPIYVNSNKKTHMAAAGITVTYGSNKAHGGRGDKLVPGMSVFAPVVFGDTPGLTFHPTNT